MSIDTHVNVTVRVNNSGIAKQGFGTVGILTYKTVFGALSKTYSQLAELIADGFETDSPEAESVARVLGQSPRPKQVKLLRGTRPPTLAYRIDIHDVDVGKTYAMNVTGEGVTETEVSYTALADLGFVDGDVHVGNNTIAEVGHGMTTGDGPYRLKNAGGALPGGLAADTNYWIIASAVGVETPDLYKLATSRANALTETAIDITSAAGGGAHTLVRGQNDTIVAQLVDQLNSVVGNNYVAAQVPGAGETDHLTVTADAAGDWFALAPQDGEVDNLTVLMTHTDPGIQDDLSDILAFDSDWYYLHTFFNSEPMVKEAAELIEATPFKAYIADVVDSAVEDTADGGGDVGDDIEALGYKRTLLFYHRNPGDMLSAGLMGKLCPLPVGSWTAAYKTIAGATACKFTTEQFSNLDAKKVSYYKTEAGEDITWESKIGNDDYGFFDVTVALDFVVDDIQKSAFAAKKALDKVAYTDDDIAIIRRAIEGAVARAASDKHKIISRGVPGSTDDPPPSVTFPKVADIDPGQRAVRNLPDGAVSFRLQGAVHTTDVTLDVSF